MPSARYKLLGKYRTPAFRYGQRVEDERRGEVRIVGLSACRMPWPIGQTKRTKSLVLFRDLARAVRRESVVAIRHWWGVGANAVRKWRKALDVPFYNEGNCASPGSPPTSAVIRPHGTVLCYQPYGEEGLLIADIDLDAATLLLASRCKAP